MGAPDSSLDEFEGHQRSVELCRWASIFHICSDCHENKVAKFNTRKNVHLFFSRLNKLNINYKITEIYSQNILQYFKK